MKRIILLLISIFMAAGVANAQLNDKASIQGTRDQTALVQVTESNTSGNGTVTVDIYNNADEMM